VLDGNPAPSPKRGQSPQFSVRVYRDQTAAWIKMSLGMDVGIGPDDIVLDADPAPLPKKGALSNFRPMSIVAKRLSRWHLAWIWAFSRPHCVRWGPSSPCKKGHSPPIFGLCLLWPNGWIWMDEAATWYRSRPRPSRPGPHCFRRGPSSPAKRAQQHPLFSAYVYCGHGRLSQLPLSSCAIVSVVSVFCMTLNTFCPSGSGHAVTA